LDRVRHPGSPLAAAAAFLRTMATRPGKLAGILARIVADGWCDPRGMAKSLAALLRGLEQVAWPRTFVPDPVQGRWATYPSTVAWALGRLLDKPFGFTCHAHDIFTERQLLARKIDEAALAVTISRYNVDWLRTRVAGDGARRLKVVHCGVDMAHAPWEPDGREDNLILAVGRLDPIKGFD